MKTPGEEFDTLFRLINADPGGESAGRFGRDRVRPRTPTCSTYTRWPLWAWSGKSARRSSP